MPRRGDPGFDDDIVRFVVSDLRTVWALELLLLIRSAPDRVWTDAALTAELRANLGMVGEILTRLQALGLAVQDREGWAYRAANAELDALCARTEGAYRQKPFAMISLIGRGSSALHDLADAFRLKGKE
jgi:hypothetical protein